jgi:hypothetical protein
MVETDVNLALRSLEVCNDSVTSRSKLVESFELGTLIWARLAESCSTMAIQSTTPEILCNVLQEYFNSINDLNEALAVKINAFILADNEQEREEAKEYLIKTIQELQTIVNELDTIVKEELSSIEREDYYREFLEEIEDVNLPFSFPVSLSFSAFLFRFPPSLPISPFLSTFPKLLL